MIISHNLLLIQSYTCNDGCEIDDSWENDDYCDCFDCGDETDWNCGTCTCPTSCGTYHHCPSSETPAPIPPTPTANPITYYDYYFSTNNEIDTSSYTIYNSQEFGCTYAGCSVKKWWYIDGQCDDARLTVEIVQTDFDGASEYAQIYINDVYFDTCYELTSACTYDSVSCAAGYSISSFLNLTNSNSSDTISITVSIPAGVDVCPYDGIYYLWTRVTISCSAGHSGGTF